MGYFPNGDAGIFYQEEWCSKCAHDKNNDCPVWLAHLLRNYEECNNENSILHMLIPRAKPIGNEKCLMFIEDPSRSQLSLF